MNEEEFPLLEGEESPPDVALNPVDADQDPTDRDYDADVPQSLSGESYLADQSDTYGMGC